MSIDAFFLRRCIRALETAMDQLDQYGEEDRVFHDVFRAACVKQFELALEQSGKLLKKRLAVFFATNRQVDRLVFKDVFRHAAKHQLLEAEAVERWIRYRDNRNDTAHDYGAQFAEATLRLLPQFVEDAKALADVVEEARDG